jgi:hypothetical protein
MATRIIHLATDAIAGMPIRLVRILQKQTRFDVNLIETKKRDFYPQDIVFGDDVDAAVSLIEKADIIHFHNNIDLDSDAFAPVNFRDLERKGTRFVRQFHSVPATIARKMKCSEREVIENTLPSIVIGQFQERYYPNALVVPNCLPVSDPSYSPSESDSEVDILFSPSKDSSAWSDRWSTKGMPETVEQLHRVSKETGCTFKVLTNIPLQRVLYEKQRSYMVLEEMITGSYHLSGLEGLSMGKPTLCYLDKRTEYIMKYISGASDVPFVNTMLENSSKIIKYLLLHRDIGLDLGIESRKWMEKYWSEESLVHHFVDMYDNLLEDPVKVARQRELRIDNTIKTFFAVTINDLIYEARSEKHNSIKQSVINNLKSRIKKVRKKLSKFVTNRKKLHRRSHEN